MFYTRIFDIIPETASVEENNREDNLSWEMKTVGEAFDTAFYLSLYSDVASHKDVDPLEHYCVWGWKERRDPSPGFSTGFYLDNNPDIQEVGINPFCHYLVSGKAEGRLASHPAGQDFEVLRNMLPLEEDVSRSKKCTRYKKIAETKLEQEDLHNLITDRLTENKVLFVAITHDNYLVSLGGVQLCISKEQLIANQNNQTYLAFFPIKSLPRLLHPEDTLDPEVGIILDGEVLGACKWSAATATARSLRLQGAEHRLVIHQLLGHDPRRIVDFADASGSRNCVLWLHDYISLCPSFTLQRNRLRFCGAPAPSSNACTLCVFGEERLSQIDTIQSLFECLNVHVVSPSEVALEIWRASGLLKESSSRVIPHITLEDVNHSASKERLGPIKVAFVGTIAPHKGWPTFLNLVQTFNRENDFEFYYFGQGDAQNSKIKTVNAQVTGHDSNAMVNALRKEEIDVVIHWAASPETFSISTFEAFSGGACVITNFGSGNVARAVQDVGLGKVFESEKQMFDCFTNGELRKIVANLRSVRARTTLEPRWSSLTLDASDVWTQETP